MIPRLRVFAGPNGSGKSTLSAWLSTDYSVNLYKYINADDLFAEISQSLRTACPCPIDNSDLISFAKSTTYSENEKSFFLNKAIRIENECVVFAREAVNSYTVAMLAEYYRKLCIESQTSFSFETVFSHPSKIEILKQAQNKGFRTYMYFIATETPNINLSRIQYRVKSGGHDVPADKIIERYARSIRIASEALPFLNRVYFFDNSGESIRFLAEVNEGAWTLYSENLPDWFSNYFADNLSISI